MDKIIVRRDFIENWAAADPILSDGEIGYIKGTSRYKMGDGIHKWSALPFYGYDGNILQDLGMDETAVMSQKAVTTAIENLVNSGLFFQGIAKPSDTDVPTKVNSFWFATETGIYTGYGSVEMLHNGISVIMYYKGFWKILPIFRVAQELGDSETEVMSQKAVRDALSTVADEIVNFPDEEDLTSFKEGDASKIRFKDKVHDELAFSGLGRVYLRKNIVNGKNVLTQDMMPLDTGKNTIYIIQYDYTIAEGGVTVPENCVLKFDGGSLSEGTLNFNNSVINSGLYSIFKNISLTGSIKNDFNFSWIGVSGNNPDNKALLNSLYKIVGKDIKSFILSGSIVISENEINLPQNIVIKGEKKANIVFTSLVGDYCISISKNTRIEHIDFYHENKEFTGSIILLNTEIRSDENNVFAPNNDVTLNNVCISGKWNEETDYKCIGVKIVCRNEKYDDAYNYITGLHFVECKIIFCSVGVYYTNENFERKNIAWSNEFLFNNLYISASMCGISTRLLENASINLTNSTGLIVIDDYSFQALVKSAIAFSSDGLLHINTLNHYDSDLVGENFGSVIIDSFLMGQKGSSTSDSYVDDKGKYEIIFGIKNYESAQTLVTTPYVNAANKFYISKPNYDLYSGISKVSMICKDANTFGIRYDNSARDDYYEEYKVDSSKGSLIHRLAGRPSNEFNLQEEVNGYYSYYKGVLSPSGIKIISKSISYNREHINIRFLSGGNGILCTKVLPSLKKNIEYKLIVKDVYRHSGKLMTIEELSNSVSIDLDRKIQNLYFTNSGFNNTDCRVQIIRRFQPYRNGTIELTVIPQQDLESPRLNIEYFYRDYALTKSNDVVDWLDYYPEDIEVSVVNMMSDITGRPTLTYTGMHFIDPTLGHEIVWNGTEWVNTDGTQLDKVTII